jgi:uncharacterized membrane protein
MAATEVPVRPSVPITMLATGIVGIGASFALILDKLALLENPDAPLSCNFSVLIGCGTNLNSAQGEVFGFPNPLLGLVFWSAVVTAGVAMLAGGRFAPWFWAVLGVGVVGAFALVVWFVAQSIFVLRVLCPWCLVTWAVTIPLFLVVVLHVMQSATAPRWCRTWGAALFRWIPLLTLLAYVTIAALAQWQLDVIGELGL